MGCRWPRITNPKVAILLMTFYGFSGGCLSTYQVSMVSTMEKRFEWPTGQVGWMLSADDIGYLTTVLLVAYFSSANNQTLVLSLSSVVMFCAACLRSSPFFIFGSKFSTEQILGLKNLSISVNALASDAAESATNFTDSFTEKYIPNFGQQQLWAFVIQIGGGILHGVAATPFWNVGLALIDDMGGKDSGAYLGFVFLTRTLSPIVGFVLGGLLTGVNENLFLKPEDFQMGTRDPKWVGAWWLGIIGIGSVVFINTPMLAMLDVKKLQEAGEKGRQKAREKAAAKANESKNQQQPSTLLAAAGGVGSVTSLHAAEQEGAASGIEGLSLRDLFKVLKDLYSNPVFLFMFFGNIFEFAAFVIFIAYFPKYIEYHFYVSAKEASMMSSISLAGASALAIVISSLVSKIKPMSMTQMNLYHAIVNTVSACLFPLLFLFNCDKIDMIGSHNFKEELPKLNMSVSAAEQCHKYSYRPICVSNKSFMTPCYADCLTNNDANVTQFTNCLNKNVTGSNGVCSPVCSSVYFYLAIFFVIRVIGTMAAVQFSMVMLNLPKSRKHKALSMGSISFLFGLLGIITPPITGSLIDTVCIVQNPSASGRSFCLFYDTDKFRYLVHCVGAFFQIPSCILFFLSYRASRKRYPDKKDLVVKEDVASEGIGEQEGEKQESVEMMKLTGGVGSE